MTYVALTLLGLSLGVFFYALRIINQYREDTDEAYRSLMEARKDAADANLAKAILEGNLRETQYALVEETKTLRREENANRVLKKEITTTNEFLKKLASGKATSGDLVNEWLSKLSQNIDAARADNNR